MSGDRRQTLWARIARYLAGEASDEEARRLEDGDAGTEELADARRIWRAGGDGGSWDVEGAWARLEDRVRGPRDRPDEGPDRPGDRRPGRRGRAAARRWAGRVAAVALLAAAGWLGWQVASDGGERTLTTAAGERLEATLEDGTVVRLAPESRVVVPAGDGAGERVVRLRGMALFEVTEGPEAPFVARAGGLDVEVTGTAFAVRAFPGDDAEEVTVREGRVRVRSDAGGDGVAVGPGQKAVLRPGSGALRVEEVDVDRALGWTEGRLAFDAVPLGRVARAIERWYGVDVTVADTVLAERRFTGTLDGATARRAAAVVAASLGADHRVEGERVTFFAPDPR